MINNRRVFKFEPRTGKMSPGAEHYRVAVMSFMYRLSATSYDELLFIGEPRGKGRGGAEDRMKGKRGGKGGGWWPRGGGRS